MDPTGFSHSKSQGREAKMAKVQFGEGREDELGGTLPGGTH